MGKTNITSDGMFETRTRILRETVSFMVASLEEDVEKLKNELSRKQGILDDLNAVEDNISTLP